MAEKRTFKKKMTQHISCLPEMSVFDKIYQSLIENDYLLIKYAYLLQNKSTKLRAGMP